MVKVSCIGGVNPRRRLFVALLLSTFEQNDDVVTQCPAIIRRRLFEPFTKFGRQAYRYLRILHHWAFLLDRIVAHNYALLTDAMQCSTMLYVGTLI